MKIILEPAKILRENPHTRRPYSSTKTGSKKFFIRGKNFHHTSGSLPINFLRRIPRRPPTRAVRRTTAGLGTARARYSSHVYSTPSIIFPFPPLPTAEELAQANSTKPAKKAGKKRSSVSSASTSSKKKAKSSSSSPDLLPSLPPLGAVVSEDSAEMNSSDAENKMDVNV